MGSLREKITQNVLLADMILIPNCSKSVENGFDGALVHSVTSYSS